MEKLIIKIVFSITLLTCIFFAGGKVNYTLYAQPSSESQESLTITTYYPIPLGMYGSIEVKDKLVVGEMDSIQEIHDGSAYVSKGIVLKKWVDSYPRNPQAGQLIYYYNTRTKETALKMYKQDEWIRLPTFTTQKLFIKVNTSLSSLYICGKRANEGEWTECELRPAVVDSLGGCDRTGVNRRCTTNECVITIGGSTYTSLREDVWIRVPERNNYKLVCESTVNTFLGRCNAPQNINCTWITTAGKPTLHVGISSDCDGCPAWCGCAPGTFSLKYTSP